MYSTLAGERAGAKKDLILNRWGPRFVLAFKYLGYMNRFHFIRLSLALLPNALAWADHKSAPTDYIRFEESADGAQLQTAVTRFVNEKGVTVDLVGAVHIADKAYYDALNVRFRTYDCVLYELVGGEYKERAKKSATPEAANMKWLGLLQQQMKDALGLVGQMEGIRYDAPNFVHADMGIGEFFGTQEQKGESFLGLWMKAWKAQMEVGAEGRKFDQPGLAKILEILCRKDSAPELKRLVGREFDQVERLMEGIESDGGTVIIAERNRLALQVLETEVAKGKRKIGIFYGAAHMPDMEHKLEEKGFILKATDWLTAWDLPPEQK
jgi:hypothetical protein